MEPSAVEAGGKGVRLGLGSAVKFGETWARVVTVGGVAGLVVGANLFSLLRTPPPFIDEVWFANRAWALITTGLNFGTLDSGVFDSLPGYWTYFPWLPSVFQGLGLWLLGLDLLGLRAVSLGFGLMLLAAVYLTVSRLAGFSTGLIALFLVGLSRAFVYSAHLGRPDIMTAAFGFGAIALYITTPPRFILPGAFLAGLLAGLSVEFHPFGGLYVGMLGFFLLVELALGRISVLGLGAFAGGVGLGLGVYLGLHVLPYPETYAAINNLVALSTGAVRTPPILTPDPRVWVQSLVDMGLQFGSLWNLRIPLVFGGAVLLARSRNPDHRRLLLVCLLLLFAYLGLIRNKNPWYAIMAAPAGDMLAAAFIDRLLGSARSQAALKKLGFRRTGWVKAALLGGLLLVLAVPTLTRMVSNPLEDYRLVIAELRRTVPAGGVVMGPATYWLGLPDTRYISWEQLVYYRRFKAAGPGEAIAALGVEYFIIDTYISKFITDVPRDSVNAQQLTVSRSELMGFLARHATVVARVETGTYGVTTVYRISP